MRQRTLYFCLWLSSAAFSASHHPEDFLNHVRGAPRIDNESDWKPRLKQGMKRLLKHTDEGLNAMPARGGCFECSDAQLILAILAMLPKTTS